MIASSESIPEIKLTLTTETLANTHLYSKNFVLNPKELSKYRLTAKCITGSLETQNFSVDCDVTDIQADWTGLIYHVDTQSHLSLKINALMYWLYLPIQYKRGFTFPSCYTVSDTNARDAHCVVIASSYLSGHDYLTIAVMVICDLHPYHGNHYKSKYQDLDFDPNNGDNRIGRVQMYFKTRKNYNQTTITPTLIAAVDKFIATDLPKLPYCPVLIDFCWKRSPVVIKKPVVEVTDFCWKRSPVVIKKPVVEVTDETLCVVCIDAARTHVVIPCGHFHYCSNCVQQLTACATCRQPIDKSFRVFQ